MQSTSRPLVAPDAESAARRVAAGFLGLGGITFALLVFGATVRVHGAGLACPDWPLCFGEVVPELSFQVGLEWGHRVLASLVSFGFLTLGVLTWRLPQAWSRARGWLGFAGVVLVTQVVLGGLTVLHLLADWSVTLHLLTGNLFLCCLWGVAMRVRGPTSAEPTSLRVQALGVGLLAAWFGQMALGGLVSSNYAGLACTEWPTCNGGVWFPTWSGIVGLQLVHRLGAYSLATLVVVFAVVTRRDEVAGLARGLVGLVVAQMTLGILNVKLGIPVETAVLHSAVGDAMGVVITFALGNLLSRPAREVPLSLLHSSAEAT